MLGFLFMMFFISGVLAAPNLKVEKIEKSNLIIVELNEPAEFEFVIDNNGIEDNYEIYSLVGLSMGPKGTFKLVEGENRIDVTVYVNEEIKKNSRGVFSYEYQLKGQNSGIFKDSLTVKIVSLADILEVGAEPVVPEDKEINVFVRNLGNRDLEDLSIKFESEFFKEEEAVSLAPFEKKHFSYDFDSKGFNAGDYPIESAVEFSGAEVEIEGAFSYLEGEGISVNESSSGFLIRKNIIKKSNVGNVPLKADVEIRKGIVARLFTSFSEEPSSIERGTFFVDYKWERNLGPGDSLVVISTTNYTIPFVLLVLIILVGIWARVYFFTFVVVKKRVVPVRTKGGEFALKIILRIKSRRGISNVKLVDSLPGMTKLYDGFGKRPDKVDAERRKLIWNLGGLEAGEERVVSYVIYSKLRTVGKFDLSAARLIFDENGKIKSVNSNRTSFVSDVAE